MVITSEMRYGYNWRIIYRYYLDGNELWFNFNDVCDALLIESSGFKSKYFKQIPMYNKRTFDDYRNKFGIIRRKPETEQYINKAAYEEFVIHEIDRANMLYKDMELLEVDLGLKDPDSGYEIKHIMGNIVSELSKKESDITKVRNYTNELFNTPQIQNIVKDKYYDKTVKDELNEIKSWLEKDYDPENSMYVLSITKHEGYTSINKDLEVDKYIGPTIDEALDALYKAGLE